MWKDLSTPSGGSPPTVRNEQTLFAIGGYVYVFAGWRNSGVGAPTNTNDLHEYDVAMQSWRDISLVAAGTPPSLRHGTYVAVSGNAVYMFGGLVGTSNPIFTDSALFSLTLTPAVVTTTITAVATTTPTPSLGGWTDLSVPAGPANHPAVQWPGSAATATMLYVMGGTVNNGCKCPFRVS
eukprot:2434009-Rhodomonas_salina.3